MPNRNIWRTAGWTSLHYTILSVVWSKPVTNWRICVLFLMFQFLRNIKLRFCRSFKNAWSPLKPGSLERWSKLLHEPFVANIIAHSREIKLSIQKALWHIVHNCARYWYSALSNVGSYLNLKVSIVKYIWAAAFHPFSN